MGINPLALLKMKERLEIFGTQHPKVSPFFKDVYEHALMPGSILEMKVTDPNGKNYVTNLRLTEEDVETIRMLRNDKGDSC